jgi:hypothetical protein
MRKLLILGCLLALFCVPSFAQSYESSITGQIFDDNTTCTTGVCVTLRLPLAANSASVTISAVSAYTGTVTFEASADNENWVSVAGSPAATGVAVTTAAAVGVWRFNVAGFRYFRVRGSAYTSGQIKVFIVGSTATAIIGAQTGP